MVNIQGIGQFLKSDEGYPDGNHYAGPVGRFAPDPAQHSIHLVDEEVHVLEIEQQAQV